MRAIRFIIIPLLGLVICAWSGVQAYRAGMSSLYALVARAKASTDVVSALGDADKAIGYDTGNPESHLAKGSLLLAQRKNDEVRTEIMRAINLLPRDYFVWLELGRARDFANDEAGALAALDNAVKLAPHYADVAWQLGNTLLRGGRQTEGFAELRRAALRNPRLWPALIDLAASLTGDLRQVELMLKPETKEASMAFARYYAKHDKPSDALRQFTSVAEPDENQRIALLSELFAAQHYAAAREIWLLREGKNYSDSKLQITNGGFEFALTPDEKWFGWRISKAPSVLQIATDLVNPQSGEGSVRVDFSGDALADNQLLWQYVPLTTTSTYSLSFYIKTKEIVSGGLPVMSVIGLNGNKRELLASSGPLPSGTTGWRKFEIPFTGKPQTKGISIELQRKGCSSPPCPLFGSLWLDDFTLRSIK